MVVAEAEILGIVPEWGYSVTVHVAHHEIGPASAAARTQQLHKLIEQAAVVRRLFGGVVVVVVADADKRPGLGTIKPESGVTWSNPSRAASHSSRVPVKWLVTALVSLVGDTSTAPVSLGGSKRLFCELVLRTKKSVAESLGGRVELRRSER